MLNIIRRHKPLTIEDVAGGGIENCAKAWGVDRDAAAIALNVALLYRCQGTIQAGDIYDLAQTIDLYGSTRERLGREETLSEKGE